MTSLDVPIGEDGETSLGDLVARFPTRPPTRSTRRTSATSLRRAVADLPSDERKVIVLRFGMHGNEPMTLQQVADELDSTRDRVRRIERDALTKLADELVDLREARLPLRAV